jgi:hypothetical protein
MMTHLPPPPAERVPRPLTEEEQARVNAQREMEVSKAFEMAQSLVTPTKERKGKKEKKAVVNHYRDADFTGRTVEHFGIGAPAPTVRPKNEGGKKKGKGKKKG